ncbi:MAG: BatD family protein [Candidatus Tantalella remota]|nr:BatD family protein [Candidatus Tantalella remota]
MRYKKLTIIFIFTFALICVAGELCAEEIKFKILLEKEKVTPGERVRMELIFFDRTDVPKIDIPEVEGLDIRYRGSSIKPITEDGSTEDSAVYMYSIVSRAAGSYTIGSFRIEQEGDVYVSDTAVVEVTEGEPEGGGESSEKKDILDGRIYLEVEILRDEVFENEKIPVVVKLYTDWLDLEDLAVFDEIGMTQLAGVYKTGKSEMVTMKGVNYAVMDFSKWFFIPTPGEYTFGPVKARFNIVELSGQPLNYNEDFYKKVIGRHGKHLIEIESPKKIIKVLPLPAEGRPDDFKGAMGSFTLEAVVAPKKIKEGAIVNLTTEISGYGNYKTVSAPEIREQEGLRVYEPTAEEKEGRVIFTRGIQILSADIKAIPDVKFSYFDPVEKKYFSLFKGPFPVAVSQGGGLAAVEKAKGPEEKKEPLAEEKKKTEEMIDIKTSAGDLRKASPVFYGLAGTVFLGMLPLFFLGTSVLVKKRMDRLVNDTAYAGWIQASKEAAKDLTKARSLMRKGDPERFYDHVFRMTQRYLARRFCFAPGGITEEIVSSQIRLRIENGDIADAIESIFNDCYLSNYAPLEFEQSDMENTFRKVKKVITELNGIVYI